MYAQADEKTKMVYDFNNFIYYNFEISASYAAFRQKYPHIPGTVQMHTHTLSWATYMNKFFMPVSHYYN